MNMDPIAVETHVYAPRRVVWESYTDPRHVTKWNHASDDWHSPHAENDLRVGGTFNYRMEARDGSEGFDFTGTYTTVVPNERIEYTMDDGRRVEVVFREEGSATHVTTVFDPETKNPREMQRDGWGAILNSFKTYTERIAE